jgi:high-affinity iron transporter
MNGQLGGIAFVVWRESVEALLVIGILDSWLSTQAPDPRRARGFLWGGVLAGLALAGVLAAALTALGDALSEDAQQSYQTATVLIAAALIVQMLVWMRRHARDMKRDLEDAARAAAVRRNWWGVFVLALIAVAREGSETVVFLYGMLSAGAGGSLAGGFAAGLAGLAAAVLTYGALRLAGQRMPWRVFFGVTEVMLMALAGALLMTGVDGLIDLGLVPKLSRSLWDTSWLLSDGSAGGGFVSALTGYRARPNLTELIVFAAYWGGVGWFLFLRPPPRRAVLA